MRAFRGMPLRVDMPQHDKTVLRSMMDALEQMSNVVTSSAPTSDGMLSSGLGSVDLAQYALKTWVDPQLSFVSAADPLVGGCVPDTGAIMSGNINYAIAHCPAGAVLYFKEGLYLLEDTLLIDRDDITLYLAEGAEFRASSAVTGSIIHVKGTLGATTKALVADIQPSKTTARPNELYLQVAPGDELSFPPGTWISLGDDLALPPGWASFASHVEINQVKDNSTSGYLKLMRPVHSRFRVADNATVTTLVPARNVKVVGGKLTSPSTTDGPHGVLFDYAIDGAVNGTLLEHVYDSGVEVWRSNGVTIFGITAKNANKFSTAGPSGGFGYGVTSHASFDVVVVGSHFERLRHGVDFSMYSGKVLAIGNTVSGSPVAGLHLHPTVWGAQFISNTVDGGYGLDAGGLDFGENGSGVYCYGVYISEDCHDVLIADNHIRSMQLSGVYIDNYAVSNITVRGNHISHTNLQNNSAHAGVALLYPSGTTAADYLAVTVEGNIIHDCTRFGIYASTSAAKIHDNYVYNIVAADGNTGIGIWARTNVDNVPADGIEVAGNHVWACATEGIRVGDTSSALRVSSNVRVHGNWCWRNGRRGIHVSRYASGCSVTNNYVIDNSQERNQYYANILDEGTDTFLAWNETIATATASLEYYGASAVTVAVGGSGYSVGQTILLTGGQWIMPVQLQVLTLSGSAVATVGIARVGMCVETPANPVAQGSSSGGGTGATFNVTWALLALLPKYGLEIGATASNAELCDNHFRGSGWLAPIYFTAGSTYFYSDAQRRNINCATVLATGRVTGSDLTMVTSAHTGYALLAANDGGDCVWADLSLLYAPLATYLKADGTIALSANWAAGNFRIDQGTGTQLGQHNVRAPGGTTPGLWIQPTGASATERVMQWSAGASTSNFYGWSWELDESITGDIILRSQNATVAQQVMRWGRGSSGLCYIGATPPSITMAGSLGLQGALVAKGGAYFNRDNMAGGDYDVTFGGNGVTAMFINSTNNTCCIGTSTSAGAWLIIATTKSTDNKSTLWFKTQTATGTYNLLMWSGASAYHDTNSTYGWGWRQEEASYGDLELFRRNNSGGTVNSTVLYFKRSNGYVGVGAWTGAAPPTYQWDVAGTFRASGASDFSSTLAVAGMLSANGGITLGAGDNITLDAATGTKIGTGSSQKLGFWNATPISRPAVTGDISGADVTETNAALASLLAALANAGLITNAVVMP